MTKDCPTQSPIQSPDNTCIINVCLIPPVSVGRQCVAISQSLGSAKTLFTLGGNKFAHMTAFMARFPESAISAVIAATGDVIEKSKTFRCQHSGYFMTEGRYLEVSFRCSLEFLQLHESLIEALKDLRASPGKPYVEGYFAPYTAEQQQNAESTGYDLAHRLYRPHITLARYAEGGVPESFPLLPEANLSFDVATLCVYRADDNGAVYELLAAFTDTLSV